MCKQPKSTEEVKESLNIYQNKNDSVDYAFIDNKTHWLMGRLFTTINLIET